MTTTQPATKVVVLIRTTLRPDADLPAYEAMGARMALLVGQLPGFLGAKEYTAGDGEGVSIIEFDSHEALLRWRNHPEHLEAQRAGRERFYASYDVRILSLERAYDFSLAKASAAAS